MINKDPLETIVSPFSTMVVGFPAPVDGDGRIVNVRPSVVSVVADLRLGIVTVAFVDEFAGRARILLLREKAKRITKWRSSE